MTGIEEKIIDIGHEIFKGYGVDDITAQILSILNFESNEISMEELAQRTGYSLASISLKVKNIEQFWSIKRISKPGSRKTYLYMEKNLLDAFATQIRNGFETELNLAKTKITPLIEEYKETRNLVSFNDLDVHDLMKMFPQNYNQISQVKRVLI